MTESDFADALATALAESGLSLSEVRRRLALEGVELSTATLSYWRSGARLPDPARAGSTILALERVLQIGPGSLSGRVPARSRRRGAVGQLMSWEEIVPQIGVGSLPAIMRSRLGVRSENYRTLSTQETVDVDENLTVAAVTAEMIVQCVQDSVHLLSLVDIAKEPTKFPPRVMLQAGGHVEGPLVDGGDTVFGYRLVLERPLSPGETAMVEMRKEYPLGYPREREHVVVLQRRTREVLQWFRFAPGFAPDWFDEHEVTQTASTVTLTHPPSVHRSRVDFGPGYIHSRWGYIDDM